MHMYAPTLCTQVRDGQNAIIQSQLQLDFTSPTAIAGRRRLLQSNDTSAKPFSEAAEALAKAALQNGGTAAFSIDSLQDVLAGQNNLVQQGYNLAQLTQPGLTKEQRATLQSWAANLRATARQQGGAAGAQTDALSQEQVCCGTGVCTMTRCSCINTHVDPPRIYLVAIDIDGVRVPHRSS